MEIKELENWLWDIASILRGPIEAYNYKDYILPLIFLKRISDVFEDEVKRVAVELNESKEKALEIIKTSKLVRFYVPEVARWENIRKQSRNLGEYLTSALRELARENPELEGVVDRVDFNAVVSGQRLIDEDRLKEVINKLSQKRLGLEDVEPDIMGRAYEYLLRKFADGSGQSAGEFYTPKEVAITIAKLLDPEPGMKVYDPCCGSGGLLIKCHLYFFKEKYKHTKVPPLHFYGQEINPTTYAIAKMNIIIHDIQNAYVELGDTLKYPAFKEKDGSLMKFDLVVANPPWNQKGYTEEFYRFDPYRRFEFGVPPKESADWGWLQHMYASLKDKGRMAVVLDTGSVSRGSGNAGSDREKEIRKKFVDRDLISAVILLPENLFYNTTAPGVIIVIDKDKKHKNEILLINASQLYEKERPKNRLTEEGIEKIVEVYREWKEEEGFSKIITKEIAQMNDYNLSPSRYVTVGGEEKVMDLEEAVVELLEAEEERKETEERLKHILLSLGLIRE